MWKRYRGQIFGLKRWEKLICFLSNMLIKLILTEMKKVVKNRSLAICFASDLLMLLATDIS